MARTRKLRLFARPELPSHWIGTDADGTLQQWPRVDGGWSARVPYLGSKQQLQPIDPAAARGTGWPGTTGGRRRVGGDEPGRSLTIRIPGRVRAAAEELAERRGQSISDVVRDALEIAVASGSES